MSKEEGVTEEEIGAVLAIVMAVSGGRVRSQTGEIMARMKRRGSGR